MNVEIKAEMESAELSVYEQMKVALDEATEELREAQQIEEENDYSDAMESMERKYCEGYVEAIEHMMRIVATAEGIVEEEL